MKWYHEQACSFIVGHIILILFQNGKNFYPINIQTKYHPNSANAG